MAREGANGGGQSIGTSARVVPVRFTVPAEGLYEVSAEVTEAERQSTPLFVTVGRGAAGVVVRPG